MDLAQMDGLVLWLYAGLFCAGLLVWTWVGLAYLRHRPYLKIDPWPCPKAVDLGGEIIFLVLVFFLLGGYLVREVLAGFGVAFSGPEEIRDLSQALMADMGGKLIAGGLLAYLLTTRICSTRLFDGRGVANDGVLGRLPVWTRVLVIAVVTYLAIFPLVNDLMLRLGVFLVERILHIPVPEGHQAFLLLDHPDTSYAVKAATLLLAGLVSPVVEELFFRGLLQNIIYKAVRHPAVAIGITAFLFMIVHGRLYHQFPALGVLGLLLGWSYYRYRTLAVPILTHILFNSTTLLFWWLGGVGQG